MHLTPLCSKQSMCSTVFITFSIYSAYLCTASTETYQHCVLSTGGDWEGLAKLMGLSGPNGKYFCNHCLVLLSDVESGKPHAAHILPKYQKYTDGHSLILPSEDDFLRTFLRCKEMNEQYKAAGEKAKSLNFESCEHAPLLSGGFVIDTVSTTPLHISLGLGLQFLNVIEAEAIGIDKSIKTKRGQVDNFEIVYELQREIAVHCTEINEKIKSVEEKISHVVERKKEIIRERGALFKQARGRYVNNSDLAVGVRKTFENLGKEKVSLEKEKEKYVKQLKTQEGKLAKAEKTLDEIKGPFKTRLDAVLDSMKLKRAAYHSGALIGPDVKKLVQKENIKKLGKVFKEMELKVGPANNPEHASFGGKEIQAKIVALLTKFKLCYDLYTANRVLCRHEVELLAIRCSSLGAWFPVNFPESNLRRKFHLLTVDVPKQARRIKTVGMLTEQTIESIHPYINELERRFAKVADRSKKGLIICKQQNIYSQPTLNAVKKLTRGKPKEARSKKR